MSHQFFRDAICASLIAIVTFLARNSPAEQPNIVIILADDLGYGDVKPLNPQSKIPTPRATDGRDFQVIKGPTVYIGRSILDILRHKSPQVRPSCFS